MIVYLSDLFLPSIFNLQLFQSAFCLQRRTTGSYGNDISSSTAVYSAPVTQVFDVLPHLLLPFIL